MAEKPARLKGHPRGMAASLPLRLACARSLALNRGDVCRGIHCWSTSSQTQRCWEQWSEEHPAGARAVPNASRHRGSEQRTAV